MSDDLLRARREIEAVLRYLAKKRGRIRYQDLCDQVTALDLKPQSGTLRKLLSDISRDEFEAGRGMLSVVAIGSGSRPGQGFFKLATELTGKTFPDGKAEGSFARKQFDLVFAAAAKR